MSALRFPSSMCGYGGNVTSTIVRTATEHDHSIHSFNGQDSLAVSKTLSATGLGDMLLRAKYNFVKSDANAIAASIDVRLPTGDKDNLLGSGATQTKLMFLASGGTASSPPTPASATRSPTAT